MRLSISPWDKRVHFTLLWMLFVCKVILCNSHTYSMGIRFEDCASQEKTSFSLFFNPRWLLYFWYVNDHYHILGRNYVYFQNRFKLFNISRWSSNSCSMRSCRPIMIKLVHVKASNVIHSRKRRGVNGLWLKTLASWGRFLIVSRPIVTLSSFSKHITNSSGIYLWVTFYQFNIIISLEPQL